MSKSWTVADGYSHPLSHRGRQTSLQSVHLLIELTICEDLLIIVFVDEDDERLIARCEPSFPTTAQIFLPADDRGIVGIQTTPSHTSTVLLFGLHGLLCLMV